MNLQIVVMVCALSGTALAERHEFEGTSFEAPAT